MRGEAAGTPDAVAGGRDKVTTTSECRTLLMRYELSCIDFDCKPASFIPKYARQDRELCRLCSSSCC